MPPEPRTYLWEARRAGTLIAAFVGERTFEDHESDAMLRSAVERQFEIVGEALNKLSEADPELAGQIPDLPRIVAFRNILVHGYAAVDDRLVWEAATERLPALVVLLERLESGGGADRANRRPPR